MQLAGALKPIVYSGFTHNPGYMYSAHDVISQRKLLYVGRQIFLTVCTLSCALNFFGTLAGPSQKRNRRTAGCLVQLQQTGAEHAQNSGDESGLQEKPPSTPSYLSS